MEVICLLMRYVLSVILHTRIIAYCQKMVLDTCFGSDPKIKGSRLSMFLIHFCVRQGLVKQNYKIDFYWGRCFGNECTSDLSEFAVND